MRLVHHARLGSLALVTVLAAACQQRAAAPAAEVAAAPTADASEAPSATAVEGPTAVEDATPTSAAPTPVVTGRTLDIAKALGIVLTSNVMGEIEPCG